MDLLFKLLQAPALKNWPTFVFTFIAFRFRVYIIFGSVVILVIEETMKLNIIILYK